VIYRVNAVDQAPVSDPAKISGVQQKIAQINAQSEMNAYLASLKARSKVKVYAIPQQDSDNK